MDPYLGKNPTFVPRKINFFSNSFVVVNPDLGKKPTFGPRKIKLFSNSFKSGNFDCSTYR